MSKVGIVRKNAYESGLLKLTVDFQIKLEKIRMLE